MATRRFRITLVGLLLVASANWTPQAVVPTTPVTVTVGESGTITNGQFLSISTTNTVLLSGKVTQPGVNGIQVNGQAAEFNATSGSWSRQQPLVPGFNRLLVQALDSAGRPAAATNKDVVFFTSATFAPTTPIGQPLEAPPGVFCITSPLRVERGGAVTFQPGTVVLVAAGAGLRMTNSLFSALGTAENPVVFAPADGTAAWNQIQAGGPDAAVRTRHFEMIAGSIVIADGASGTIEDSYLHDFTADPIVHTVGVPRPVRLQLRRTHLARYHEILSQKTANEIEDCLLEYLDLSGDAIDFDASIPGSFIRRCTARHGQLTNTDAFDMGNFWDINETSRGVLIEGCLIYDFRDKGVSMGIAVDATVRNCLIYGVESGLGVKDDSTAGVFNCTLIGSAYGINAYNKADPSAKTGGGYITNSYNNIIWGNTKAVELLNGSTLKADYSVFQGLSVPGDGNLQTSPEFVNPAQRDYRLRTGSSLLSAGRDGGSLGTAFPVGAMMAPSHPQFHSLRAGESGVEIEFWVDSEKAYVLEKMSAPGSANWIPVEEIFPQPLPRLVTVKVGTASQEFFRLAARQFP